ncbi:hypothetical protein [Aliivibrio fischeri]|uniref:hypothetical protein n=1 Tax=Aliivibrio fischeri TaxID=668 RepID=UPI001327221C|nr:hypothetical protein [Aliivibrio fischeri]MUI54271.1 hypothetical protein [Aliivibrio fischeri]
MKIDYVYLNNRILDSCELLKFAIEMDNKLFSNNKEVILNLTKHNNWLIKELSSSNVKEKERNLMLRNCLVLSDILRKLN